MSCICFFRDWWGLYDWELGAFCLFFFFFGGRGGKVRAGKQAGEAKKYGVINGFSAKTSTFRGYREYHASREL